MAVRTVNVVAAAIWDGVDQVLVGQRAAHDSHPHVWEFIGGKQEPDESLEEALHRELLEEVGLTVEIVKFLGEHEFAGQGVVFKLYVYLARWNQGVAVAYEHQSLEWTSNFEASSRVWSEPDVPFLKAVKSALSELV